ncbi:hypothetical protein MSMTP_1784 [Methanosarcina sp. MTP4]|nr:hypothetical protein MSMTP_1784 [Methanosarcina sp. MTP4]
MKNLYKNHIRNTSLKKPVQKPHQKQTYKTKKSWQKCLAKALARGVWNRGGIMTSKCFNSISSGICARSGTARPGRAQSAQA